MLDIDAQWNPEYEAEVHSRMTTTSRNASVAHCTWIHIRRSDGGGAKNYQHEAINKLPGAKKWYILHTLPHE